MRQTTLATLTFPEVAEAFTLVYTGYFLPVAMDARGARSHMEMGDIRLDASPLWLDETGAVVGLAVLGVRGTRGWVGGFGVAPAYRGQGVSHGLIGVLLDSARQIGVRTVALEVLVQNAPAIRTYQQAGFVHRRDLRVFQWREPIAAAEAAAEVYPADPALLLARRAQLGTPPSWQREPESLARMPGLEGLALGASDAPLAFLLFRATADAVTIVDIAAPDVDTAATLVRALAHRVPGRPMRLVNEPEESAACAAIEKIGWEEILRQHEMMYTMSPPIECIPRSWKKSER